MTTIDELIDLRVLARSYKYWLLSDSIRKFLDSKLVFIFDTKDGQEVYHLNEGYFKKKPVEMSNRQYVEHRIKEDIIAEKNFDAWLYSINKSRKEENK